MAALNMLSQEREIPLDDLVDTLENALLTAYRKTDGSYRDVRIAMDRRAGTVAVMAAETDELERLTTHRDRLEHEQDRLMQAHYADARAHLNDALNLLTDCADIYQRCDDTNRRLCNQAFFTKVYIDEDDQLRVENNRPFEMLLDPEVNADALTWAENADKARTPALDSSGQGSSLVRWVHP